MDKTERILNSVLEKITPSPKEQAEIKQVTEKVLKVTEQIIKPHGLKVVLAGSFTRNTWMPHKREFDVFMQFPEKTPREELEKKGLDFGKQIVKRLGGTFKIAYAEHPYTRSKVGQFDIDIVPCFKVKSAAEIKSAVDRTPFHNQWLSHHLAPKQAGQVRLLKQLTKANGLYGSDTKTQGLSGYLCELLIVQFGTFSNFVKQASKWEAGSVIIDLEGNSADRAQVLKQFKGQPLIVVDPVDQNRNVAAVVSPENFVQLVSLCREFTKKPSAGFFFKADKKPDLKRLTMLLKGRETQILAVSFKTPDLIPDILWPQLRRTAGRIKDILQEYEFLVLGWDVWSNGQCILLFELEAWKLPAVRRIHGPNIFTKNRAQEFVKKYRLLGRLWVEGDHWVAETERPFRTAEHKLEDSLGDRLKDLMAKGFASHTAKAISNGYKILGPAGIVALAKKDAGFGVFLENYLRKNIKV